MAGPGQTTLRLTPASARQQAKDSASLRRRLRNAHGVPASLAVSGGAASPGTPTNDVQAAYADRIRRRLESALEPASPTSSSAWPSPGGSVGSPRLSASARSSGRGRPPWVSSPQTKQPALAKTRSRSPEGTAERGYSPTRETWFGATDKDLSTAARVREARELAQAEAEVRVAQHRRIEKMALDSSNHAAPAMAQAAHSSAAVATEWAGATRRQSRATTSHLKTASPSADNLTPPRRVAASPSSPRSQAALAAALPDGWETATSQSSGDTYYVNTLTGESTFERPTAPAAAAVRGRAGGRSGEQWASDVLNQVRNSLELPTETAETTCGLPQVCV